MYNSRAGHSLSVSWCQAPYLWWCTCTTIEDPGEDLVYMCPCFRHHICGGVPECGGGVVLLRRRRVWQHDTSQSYRCLLSRSGQARGQSYKYSFYWGCMIRSTEIKIVRYTCISQIYIYPRLFNTLQNMYENPSEIC